MDLKRQRGEALLDDDAMATVTGLDRAIVDAERVAAIQRDRIAALSAQLDREKIERIELARAEGIAKLEKLFAGRQELAQEVEEAIKHLGGVIGRLLESRSEIIEHWPDVFPFPRQDDLRSRIDRELSWALFSAGKPTAFSPCRIPAPSNEGLGITGVHPKGVAGAIALEHHALLDRLRRSPLADQEAAA